ncbi:hypothetical protein ACVWXO_001259 [Bradyrhizobium sp. LM2.7]
MLASPVGPRQAAKVPLVSTFGHDAKQLTASTTLLYTKGAPQAPTDAPFPLPSIPKRPRVNELSSTPTGPSQGPDFKQVRFYLHTIQQREALGGFVKAGWSPSELAEFARDVYLMPGRTYPTAASYIYAMEKGAAHPYAVETLAILRAPGFTMPPFNRPVPKQYEWDAPENPAHTLELRADIEEMWRLWRNREARKHEQPWPTEYPPIPRTLWKRLFRLRNRYHSLDDTLELEGLKRYAEPPATSPSPKLF